MKRIVLIIIGVILVLVLGCGAMLIFSPDILSGGPTSDIPAVVEMPTSTWTPSPIPPTDTLTPTITLTPSQTYTPSMTWTPLVATYTPSSTHTPTQTFTPSMTFTPSDTPTFTPTFTETLPPSYTPTEDQAAPVVLSVGPDSAVVVPRDPRCSPTTTNITANIASNVGLYTITLNYVYNNGEGQTVEMTNISENLYAASLGPFPEPGAVAYWVTMSDNWGKWQSYMAQTLPVSECDVAAINAAEATAAYSAAEATALAELGYTSGTDAFQARNIEIDVAYNTTVTISYSAINGTSPYQFVRVTNPSNGSLTTIDGYTELYTPDYDFTGTDSYTYMAIDANGEQSIGTVTLNVQDPTLVAQNATLSTSQRGDNTYTFNLRATGGTQPHDTQFIADSQSPSGTTILYTGNYTEGADSTTFEYRVTTSTGYTGDVTFRWLVTDAVGDSDEGAVTLTINPVPLTADDYNFRWMLNADASYQFELEADGTNGPYTIDILSDTVNPSDVKFYIVGGSVFNNHIITRYRMETSVGYTGPVNVRWSLTDGLGNSTLGNVTAEIIAADLTDLPIIFQGSTFTYSIEAAGPNPILQPTHLFFAGQWPSWGPGGNQFIFTANTDYFDIYDIATDTRDRLTDNNGTLVTGYMPDWSPDGTMFAYIQWTGSLPPFNIYVMEAADGGTPRQLTFDTVIANANLNPTWGADNFTVYYQHYNGSNWDIYKVPSDLSTAPQAVINSAADESAVAISRDGLSMAFVLDGVLHTAAIDGSNIVSLDITGDSPTWSPDGTQLAYTNGGLWVVNADGTNEIELQTSDALQPDWVWP